MKITDHEPVPVDAALIDRLVDGELGEAARAALLRDLDRDPAGWKRCALAFLEAQAWREACAGDAVVAASQPSGTPGRRRPGPHKLAAAAAVLIAFFTGFATRGTGTGAQSTPGGGQMLVHRPPLPPAAHPNVAPAPPSAAPTPSAVPEYVRRQMERQGYQVGGNVKMVPVALDDGRKLSLPVETVSLRYVGQRIH